MLRVGDLNTLKETVRSWKSSGLTVGLVPTMGALHSGHLSLVDASVQSCDRTIASIFVNPTQFAAHEDLGSYPRTYEQDCKLLENHKCDLVFSPDVSTMYPEGEETRVSVPALGAKLEGEFRPHFFGGVATIVAKLFNMMEPDKAFFGEKDFQQVQVIRRMVKDLAFPIEVVACPTGRDIDGLALSSRNAYLSEEERKIAPMLYAAMHRLRIRVRAGTSLETAINEAVRTLLKGGFKSVDYIKVCDLDTLDMITDPVPSEPCRLLAAAWLGKTRLIDNFDL